MPRPPGGGDPGVSARADAPARLRALLAPPLAAAVSACAERVRRGDPDRFMAAMAAPPPERAALMVLAAFNLELARAAWSAREPLIGAMRLQWWRDRLADLAAGRAVPFHEVLTPLAALAGADADADAATRLDALAEARGRELDPAPFATRAELMAHLEATGGRLMLESARLLGAPPDPAAEDAILAIGTAAALANWFLAAPALIARNRAPLPADALPADALPADAAGTEAAADACVRALADAALRALDEARRVPLSVPARRAALGGWRARAILRRARAAPRRVREGGVEGSEFRRRASLLRASLFGL